MAARGYQEAGVYEGGRTPTGIGGGIIAAGPGGHVPEQAFAGNGYQAEGHAQPAGHGQDDIVLVRVRVAGIGRGDLTAPFGQGGVGGRCRQGRQQQEEEERREQLRSHG